MNYLNRAANGSLSISSYRPPGALVTDIDDLLSTSARANVALTAHIPEYRYNSLLSLILAQY